MLAETLVLDSDDRIVKISILDLTVGYENTVYVLGTCELREDIVLTVIYE